MHGELSSEAPFKKFLVRADVWGSLEGGLLLTTLAYSTSALPVMQFVSQMEDACEVSAAIDEEQLVILPAKGLTEVRATNKNKKQRRRLWQAALDAGCAICPCDLGTPKGAGRRHQGRELHHRRPGDGRGQAERRHRRLPHGRSGSPRTGRLRRNPHVRVVHGGGIRGNCRIRACEWLGIAEHAH